ncbi:hypothetical protein V2J09_000056 [Rumex salicifolius]
MAASTSGTKLPILTSDEGDDDDLAALFAVQQEELMAARTAHSDLDYAFHLQMNEAIAASVALSPSSSVAVISTADVTASSSSLNDDFTAATDLFAEEMDRMKQEQANLRHFKVEMRRMKEDFDLRLHDQKVASEILAIPEQEWLATGDYYEKPYSQMAFGSPFASSTAIGGSSLGFSECFRLYFKGLVVGDQNRAKLGAIGVAIFDSTNSVVLEVSKPLILSQGEMRDEVAQLEAFVHGLELALSLELRRIAYDNVDSIVDYYLQGNQKGRDAKVAELVDRALLLKKRFIDCSSSPGTMNNAQLALSLARSSIAKQAGKPVEEIILAKENCPICLEDVDSTRMFEIGRCHHRFCSSCMQKHIELKVKGRELPRCPQLECGLDLNFNVCRKFLNPETYDVMDQLVKESSIPVVEKVYCPNPRCSNLMSRADALKSAQIVAGTSRVNLRACRCSKCHILFCISCKVPWHSDMSCDYYLKYKPNLSSADAKLKSLAGDKKWRQCPRCYHMVELDEDVSMNSATCVDASGRTKKLHVVVYCGLKRTLSVLEVPTGSDRSSYMKMVIELGPVSFCLLVSSIVSLVQVQTSP